jgi:hypothetical protein
MFNALNSNVVLAQNQSFGATLDQPSQIRSRGCCASRVSGSSKEHGLT